MKFIDINREFTALVENIAQGYYAMPLRDNIPEPGRDDWKLTTCPICRAECWKAEIARQALAAEPELRAACTACALRGGRAGR